MDIRGLGYVCVESTDPQQWLDYGTQVLGMMVAPGMPDNGAAYLKMDERPFRIAAFKSEQDRFGCAGWEVADAAALETAAGELEQADVQVVRGSADEIAARRVQDLIRFQDPDGNRHEIFWGPAMDFARFVSPVGVSRFVTDGLGLGHVVLPAPQFDATRDFYAEVMGFGLSDLMKVRFTPDPNEPEKRLHFMHCNNGRHHSLAIFEAPMPGGCVHMMVEVESMDEVGRALDRMQAKDIKLSATLGKHTNDEMISFYMKTPGGFDLEYGCGGKVVDWDRHTSFESTVTSHWGHDFSIGFK
ncbi:MAG: VOC family protein [Oceanospirillaceae bacterium]|nr:VOC family protein [Oceanospirillaceae bacterium]